MTNKKETEIIDAETTQGAEVTELVPITNTVYDCKGQELVVYGERGEIISTTFDRINFGDSQSVLKYGTDVAGLISQILSDTSKLYDETKVISIDSRMLAKLSTFEESLDESEKEKEKEAKKPAIIKHAEGLIEKLAILLRIKKEEDLAKPDKTTYKGRLEEYLDNLEKIKEAVESQKQRQINDIQTRFDTMETINPLLNLLEQMHKVAMQDKAAFDQSILLLEAENPNPDVTMERKIKFQKGVSQLAEKRLGKLNENLIALTQAMQQYDAQQFTAMSLVEEQDSFLSHTSKILEAQGGLMIQHRVIGDDINDMQQITKAANQAVVANADKMLENAQAIVDLRLNGGLTLDTLKHVNNTLIEGKQVLEKGAEAERVQLEQYKVEHEKLLQDLKDYADTSSSYLADRSLAVEIIEGVSQTPVTKSLPMVKKKGTRK